jgi:intein/homing endonuclease
MNKNYSLITINHLSKFKINKLGDKFCLSLSNCKNKVLISLPFVLDERVGSLAGMMPDGSLIKDLKRVYFTQKKDFRKILQFRGLLIELFSPTNKVFIRDGHNAFDAYTNSTVLANFLYHVLDFSKSDEEMKVPKWMFLSPDSVKRAYLREAFAMEGTIFKSLKEIRFITKDKDYALGIQALLNSLKIGSFVQTRIGGTHRTIQYRVSIYRKENFEKFKEIGFTSLLHVERFNLICQKYQI